MPTRRQLVKSLCLAGGISPATSRFLMTTPEPASHSTAAPQQWWKTGVIYQIYPRSFQDSNGDGIGDFPGITSRLSYVRDLGVDAIFVNACFDSPNADYGYDVRDYRKIHPDFGTMDDFDRFVTEAHKLKLRVILDMVFNHSSDEHTWFQESRKSRNNPYRDYYFWRDPVNGGPPTNWPCAYGGSAWEFDKHTGQFYLHHYAIKQPDLNWENPKVRRELYAVLNFWANKGADGFRFDCAGEISKPLPFRNMTTAELKDNVIDYRTSGPRLDAYFKEMRASMHAFPDVYFVGEGWGMTRESVVRAVDDSNHELDSAFRFDFQLLDITEGWRRVPFSLPKLKAFNQENQFADHPHVWPIVFLEDHDFSRSIARFGSSRPEFQARSAKLLATMLFSLRGTPLVYQGEEIGMTNFPFTSVSQYDDIGVHNLYRDLVQTGKVSAAEYLSNNAQTSRDNSRTPMQWNASAQAGFTTSAKPWLAVNPNHSAINVEAESRNRNSVLSFYRQLIAIRKSNPALIFGSYRDISGDSSQVYAYVRRYESSQVAVILNFSDSPAHFHFPADFRWKRVVIGNIEDAPGQASTSIQLSPWQSLIVE
jgi:oligo-1,6-glucosidase